MRSDKQKLRDQTSAIVDNLLPENKLYFDDLRDYMLIKSFFKDEKTILEQIYTMAVDLQEAEKDGLSAIDFFGSDAKGMADQLLENAPKITVKEMIITFGSTVLSLYAIEILLLFSNTGHFQLEFWTLMASCFIGIIVIWLAFVVLPPYLFKEKSSKIVIGLVVIVSLILFNVIYELPDLIGDRGISLRFPEVVDWLFVIVTGLILSVFAVKVRFFRPFVFPISAFLLTGIIKKLLDLKLVTGDLWSVWIPLTLSLIGLLMFYLLSTRLFKEKKSENMVK